MIRASSKRQAKADLIALICYLVITSIGHVAMHWSSKLPPMDSWWGVRPLSAHVRVARLDRNGSECDVIGGAHTLGLRTADCDVPAMGHKIVRWWDGSRIAALYDQAGTNNLYQEAVAKRPLFLEDGPRRMIQFDGSALAGRTVEGGAR